LGNGRLLGSPRGRARARVAGSLRLLSDHRRALTPCSMCGPTRASPAAPSSSSRPSRRRSSRTTPIAATSSELRSPSATASASTKSCSTSQRSYRSRARRALRHRPVLRGGRCGCGRGARRRGGLAGRALRSPRRGDPSASRRGGGARRRPRGVPALALDRTRRRRLPFRRAERRDGRGGARFLPAARLQGGVY
jgi:hypothetical protein